MTTQAREQTSSDRTREPSNQMVGVASPDAVAIRAYEIFERRGREPGRDVDDWLRAEQELQGASR
jgi:hypothetical protein